MSILAALVLFAAPPTLSSQISPPSFVAKQPQVAASGKRVFVVCGQKDRLFVLGSADGGKSFSAPIALPTSGKLALGMRRGPRIALSGRTIVVSAIYGKGGNGQDGELVAWRSTDEGKTWAGPAPVSDVPGAAREGLHAMAASPTGRLACTWLDLRNKSTEMWLSTSDDAGATWSKNSLVYRSPSGTVCECCHPSIAFGPDGNLHVMFRNWLGGARDMYLASSTIGGTSFSPAQKLGTGTWPLNACPMDGGALVVNGDGTVETVWRREGKVYACTPGKVEREIGRGTQPWIATTKDGSRIVWLGEDGRVRATGSEGLAGGTDPVVVSFDGRTMAVWADQSGRILAQRF